MVACVKVKEKTSLYDWFVVEHRGVEPLTSTMRMLRATEVCVTHPHVLCSGWLDKLEFVELYKILYIIVTRSG